MYGNLYNSNIVFKKDADAVTAHVLNENPFRKIAIGKTQIEIGVHYLLSEFAFMLFLPEYVEEEVVGYIYHKPWPVFGEVHCGRIHRTKFKTCEVYTFSRI